MPKVTIVDEIVLYKLPCLLGAKTFMKIEEYPIMNYVLNFLRT